MALSGTHPGGGSKQAVVEEFFTGAVRNGILFERGGRGSTEYESQICGA